MAKNRRLDDLERAAGVGVPDDTHVVISWLENDDITATYIVNGERLTEHEFKRRWPDWTPPAAGVVSVNWE